MAKSRKPKLTFEDIEFVHLVFYTDPPGRPLGKIAAEVLRAIVALVDLPKVEYFWYTNAFSEDVTKEEAERQQGKSTLSQAATAIGLASPDTNYIWLGAPRWGSTFKPVDINFGIRFNAPPPPEQLDEATFNRHDSLGPTVDICVNRLFLERIGRDGTQQFLDGIVDAMDAAWTPYYGFIECEWGNATQGSWLFSEIEFDRIDKRIAYEEAVWWHPTTDRRALARRVYWGNYFGRHLVERLQRDQDVLSAFEGLGYNGVPDPNLPGPRVRRLPSGAAICSLSNDVFHSSPIDGVAYLMNSWYNAPRCWLHARLRERRMLA